MKLNKIDIDILHSINHNSDQIDLIKYDDLMIFDLDSLVYSLNDYSKSDIIISINKLKELELF